MRGLDFETALLVSLPTGRLSLVQDQDGMKAALQELLLGEHVGTVRRALAMAAAAVARICVPAGQWPALLPWLHGCTQSPSEAQRETALMLICSLIDTIGDSRTAACADCALTPGPQVHKKTAQLHPLCECYAY